MRPSLLPLASALLTAACVGTTPLPPPPPPATANEARPPVTILVSIDGFRADYLDRGVTPVLSRLAADGVRAPMRPSFPSKTFPNHWTLVTGLVPDHHGIVANSMEDASRPGDKFTMSTDDPFWWNAAEPIWVTAERAGIRTATEFWPGANVAWGGHRPDPKKDEVEGGARPSEWHQYAGPTTSDQRADAVVDWLRRPLTTRPRFLTLYFETVDHAGHDFGPDSPEVNAAAIEVDTAIGRLVDGLAALGQPANLVIVADHGMAATSSDRVIALDRITDPATYRVFETGPYASLYPAQGQDAALARALLRPHPHMQCWRKDAIPARFRYGTNPRIPPYLCLAETGWQVAKTAPTTPDHGGNHGYDDHAPEMRALFVANGPAFRGGRTLPGFPNTDVAPLLRDLLGLPPGERLDGDDTPFREVLKR